MRLLLYTGTSIIITTGKKIFYILDGELPACLTKNKSGIFSAVLKRFISLEEINLSLAGTTSKLAAMVIMSHFTLHIC